MAFFTIFLSFFTFQFQYAQSVTELQPSDSLIITNWTTADGLPVNATNRITQGPKGYLWITTFDGIVRFNGHKFKVYNHANTPAIPHNRTIKIYYQKGTGLWISLEYGGILLFKDGEFIHFGENTGLTNARITNMLEDSLGRFWVGTLNGLYIYDSGKFIEVFKGILPLQNHIVKIFEDSDETIWALTLNGLIKINSSVNSTKVFKIKEGSRANKFRDMVEIDENVFLLATNNGLYKFDGSTFTKIHFSKQDNRKIPHLYKDKNITLVSADLYHYVKGRLKLIERTPLKNFMFFYRDSNDILWMIDENGSLAYLQNRGGNYQVQYFHRFNEYHFNSIYEDREGNLWLTTAREGIVRIKHELVRTITSSEGLTGSNINAVFEDSKGRFWIGTRDYGLNMIDDGIVTHFRQAGALSGDIVISIAEDKMGNIWVGSVFGGVDKITPHGVINFRFGRANGLNTVRSIYVAGDSTIWLGTYGGLIKFDPSGENQIIYTTADGLADNHIRFIDEDKNGGLWIATFNGLSYFKNGTFTNYTTEDGLSANNIRSVYVDEFDTGTVWVGTETAGLNRIRNGAITSIGREDGLPDHVIHYISQDSLGWLWMSSNHGIFKIKKDELNAYMDGKADYFSLVHYGKNDGMLNPECNGAFQNGGLRTSSGSFWFATQNGVAIIDIDSSQYGETRPSIVIKSIQTAAKTFTGDTLSLKPSKNSFEVHFYAVTFTNPGETQYRYMLKGYDENWKQVVGKRTVTYANIPDGSYIFKVQAASSVGEWYGKPARAAITIKPFFYEQWWFFLLVIFVAVIGYYGTSRIRYHYLMKRQMILKKKIDEQTYLIRSESRAAKKQSEMIEKQAEELRKMNEMKNKLFSIIGHDLRNPLAGVIGLSDLLLEDHKDMDSKQREEMLRGINHASKSIHQLSENILQWASLQNGGVKFSAETINVNKLIEQNIDLFLQQVTLKNITLKNTSKDDIFLFGDKDMSNTIVRNLLSNAIKFTEKDGAIILHAVNKNDECHITISDSGMGMPTELVVNLMGKDDKASRMGTDNEKGNGLGLSLCKELAEIQGGSIWVKSEEGKGSVFTLILPEKDNNNGN